ncbi:MAG: amino acid ABC transporter permease [Clostridia bacterium]|nr:amino acid ABC transporter permease [Clostridia bacterium]
MNFLDKIDLFKYTVVEKGAYVKILTGLKNTVTIAVIGLLIGIVIGTLIAVVKVIPKHGPVSKALDKICTVYVAYFRGTPIVVQLLLGYFILFPLLNIKVSSLIVCIIIFGLNSGAYVSEIMRSGILSVDPGQMEAGRAVGFSYGSTMMRIVVPQAVKNILPTLGNEFITLIKETSVVNFVGATDLVNAFSYIGSSNYEFMVPYLAMALIYIVLVLLITGLVRIMEKRLRASDKR